MSEQRIINSLYEHFKNSPKKLKIVCDWDEVIQACEPFAFFKRIKETEKDWDWEFKRYFKDFWEPPLIVEYSPYDSKIKEDYDPENDNTSLVLARHREIKNSPNFYQKAPFLTIAEDLLKLIKEDKVEKLIFLSAYDKRVFPKEDDRKWDIFDNTFQCFDGFLVDEDGKKTERRVKLKLIPFDSEQKGQTKADWIKQNASDFDIVIDDNPNICKKLLEMKLKEEEGWDIHQSFCMGCSHHYPDNEYEYFRGDILAPYYPAVVNQHHEDVLLVKNEVSNLKKEDFK